MTGQPLTRHAMTGHLTIGHATTGPLLSGPARISSSTIGFSPTARKAETTTSSRTDAISLTASAVANASSSPIPPQKPR